MLANMYSPLIHSCTPSLQLPGAYFGLALCFGTDYFSLYETDFESKGLEVHRARLDLFKNSMVIDFHGYNTEDGVQILQLASVFIYFRFSQQYIAEY
jgi:hypothetical protein